MCVDSLLLFFNKDGILLLVFFEVNLRTILSNTYSQSKLKRELILNRSSYDNTIMYIVI